mmetsp:Transcript_14450/g.22059  ORF Transcript_14450/g.22059 Transcript_14450/m.22059 type:complete len:437 (+) Transcript_14450:224-1534(+)
MITRVQKLCKAVVILAHICHSFASSASSSVSAAMNEANGIMGIETTNGISTRNEIITITEEQRLMLLQCSSSEEFASRFHDLCSSVRSIFDREGVVVIRGLLDDSLLEKLDRDSMNLLAKKQGFKPKKKLFENINFGPVFSHKIFREVALSSAIPRFVAHILLNKDCDGAASSSATSLRVLRDAYLVKSDESECCGWHVDDFGFWPTNARSSPGVNAWIAIDDIPTKHGGGLGVSPKSHRASWKFEAYESIGSTQLHSDEGLVAGTAFFNRMMKGKDGVSLIGRTCDMQEVNPELSQKLDDTRKMFDFQKGDVLFHTRWIFHRSMPLTTEGRNYFEKQGKKPSLRRYSIRYEHGNSRLLRGFTVENSVALNPENAGKTLDEVCANDGPFYPKCWPQITPEELTRMDHLLAEKLPEAMTKSKPVVHLIMEKANSYGK